MMLLVSATELLTLFVALELSAYALYVLVALNRRQRAGSEGAAKYLLFLPPLPVTPTYQLASYLTLALIGCTGIYPGPLWDLCQGAARAVLGT